MTIAKKFGAIGSMLALVVTGLVAAAGSASATTPTVFDLNGFYNSGEPANPVISNVNDVLTIDMSRLGRPAANGVVLTSDTIIVTFPDDGTFTAKLVAPGSVLWSNSTVWTKTSSGTVPNVVRLDEATARSRMTAAGFGLSVSFFFTDRVCTNLDKVASQSPVGGTQAALGTVVTAKIRVEPPSGCP
ncbi:PASTA domain-containing protein [Actinophytocola sp.]|uniref:PASTA domain-containing protein n=1 Tax=Actinophytocola sp. TaxID=1872138 RepID=UPI003899E62A